MVDAIIEILSALLPDGDVWKALVILLIVFTITKYPWIWLGRAIQYVFRWVWCYCFGRHSYVARTATGNVWGQIMSGTMQCSVCHRIEHF